MAGGRRATRAWPALSAALLVAACSGSRTHPPDKDGVRRGLLLTFTDLRGTVKPCGCSPDLRRGGLARIAQHVMAERQRQPTLLLLHAGDLLLDDEGIPAGRGAQVTRRTEAVASALRTMGLAATTVGPHDLAQGLEWLRQVAPGVPAPIVATNVTGPAWALIARPRLLLTAGSLRVGVLGLIPPGPGVTDPEAAARAGAQALRRDGADVVVALSALGLRAARRLLRKQVGLDVLVAGGQGIEAQPWDEAERVGGTWMVQSHIQGGRVSRLRLEVKGNGPLALGGSAEAATAQRRFGYDVTPIHWDLPEEAAVAAEMARYNQELKAINLAAAGTLPPAKPGEAVYVGAARCLECHEQVEAFWAKNEHAHAWETLEKDQKTFDLECVSCHVTGYGRPGGSILGALKNLTSVQCEACHGPGSRHVEAGDTAAILRSPGPDVCTTCHNPKHSTGFDYKKYRARLLVPGHGK